MIARGGTASILVPGALEEMSEPGGLARFATIAAEMMLVSRERLGDMRESKSEYQIEIRAKATH